MKGSLIVAANVKSIAKVDEKQLNVSEEFYRELEKKLNSIIERACKRARENGRTTVMGRDV